MMVLYAGRNDSIPQEPLVTLQLEDKVENFLIDTGACHSVLNDLEGQIGDRSTTIIGAT